MFLKEKPFSLKLFFCVIFSLAFALALLLFFSLIIFFTGANDFLLTLINVVIRLLAIGLCVFLSVDNSGGIFKGGVAGLAVSLGVGILFFILSGEFSWLSFALNTLFGVVFGIIFGIIFVNLKNKV